MCVRLLYLVCDARVMLLWLMSCIPFASLRLEMTNSSETDDIGSVDTSFVDLIMNNSASATENLNSCASLPLKIQPQLPPFQSLIRIFRSLTNIFLCIVVV